MFGGVLQLPILRIGSLFLALLSNKLDVKKFCHFPHGFHPVWTRRLCVLMCAEASGAVCGTAHLFLINKLCGPVATALSDLAESTHTTHSRP